ARVESCTHNVYNYIASSPHYTHTPSHFFFNATAPTDIYTLSLHDALPIFFTRPYRPEPRFIFKDRQASDAFITRVRERPVSDDRDRKSTRLNSSHVAISYAVFCLKKKKIRSKSSPTAECQQPPNRAPSLST